MVNHGPTGLFIGNITGSKHGEFYLNNRMDFGTKEWLEKINGYPSPFLTTNWTIGLEFSVIISLNCFSII